MAIITEETVAGGGDFRWLNSAHGIWNGRTITIDVSTFATDDYAEGYLPSGTPVTLTQDGLAGKYNSTKLDGFIFTNVAVAAGDTAVPAPLLDHGRIVVAEVPFEGFAVPAEAPNTGFVFV